MPAAAPPKFELKLNPALDPERYRRLYAQHKIVQIEDVLDPDTAETLHQVLERATPWRLVFSDETGRTIQLTPPDIQAMGQAAFQRTMQGILERASRNIGYAYHAYPMIEAYMTGQDPGHPLHLVSEFINSPEFRAFGAHVIGIPVVTKVDAQATLYAPGDFLTRHVDDGAERERRAAYTLGVSKGWEPDWGGLLMFLDNKRDISSAYLPRFNVLTLFDGLRIHTVSQVTNFARAGRYSITGWLRDDPPSGRG